MNDKCNCPYYVSTTSYGVTWIECANTECKYRIEREVVKNDDR